MVAEHPQGVYRRRRPETTALYQLVEQNLETWLDLYPEKVAPTRGMLRPEVEQAFRSYLECGRLEFGFCRIFCRACGEDRILAFSCQTRNLCPSCQRKRALLLAERLTEEVLPDVSFRQWVLTLPRRVRGIFRRNRALLGDLCRIAADCIKEYIRTVLGREDLRPAIVSILQSFTANLELIPRDQYLALSLSCFYSKSFV